MKAEMQAIEANKTWEVSDLPRNHKAIGLKWVFKVKRILKAMWLNTKQDSWLKDMLKFKEGTSMRSLHRLHELKQSEYY